MINLPNILTLVNLFAGMAGIYFAVLGNLPFALMALGVGALFDFSDGLAARALKVSSDIGKQLDSLADIVTFGVLPAFISFFLAGGEINLESLSALLLAAGAALRLAKFNIDDRQSDSFLGLPTPAMAIFICGLYYWRSDLSSVPVVFPVINLLLFLLMISELPLISLKVKNAKLTRDNGLRILLVVLSVILFMFFQFRAIALIIVVYIILSLIQKIWKK